MARIPTYSTTEGVTTAPNAAAASPNVAVPQAQEALGQAVGAAGASLAKVAEHFSQVADFASSTDALVDAHARIGAVRLQAMSDPDPRAFPKYQGQIAQIQQEAGAKANVRDPEQRVRLRSELGMAADNANFELGGLFRQKGIDAAHAATADRLRTLSTDFRNAQTPEQQQMVVRQVDAHIDHAVGLGLYTLEQAQKLKYEARQGMVDRWVDKVLMADPNAALAGLKDGSFEQIVPMDPEKKRQLLYITEKMASKQEAEAARVAKQQQDAAEAGMAVKLAHGQLSLDELDAAAKPGPDGRSTISREFYQASVKALTKLQDDPKHTPEEKGTKFLELLSAYSRLPGVTLSEKTGAPDHVAEGADLKALQTFRASVLANADYLTPEQTKMFLEGTQQNVLAASGGAKLPPWQWALQNLTFLGLGSQVIARAAVRYWQAANAHGATPDAARTAAVGIVKDAVRSAHPETIGAGDVPNATLSASGVVRQVYSGASAAKPTMAFRDDRVAMTAPDGRNLKVPPSKVAELERLGAKKVGAR